MNSGLGVWTHLLIVPLRTSISYPFSSHHSSSCDKEQDTQASSGEERRTYEDIDPMESRGRKESTCLHGNQEDTKTVGLYSRAVWSLSSTPFLYSLSPFSPLKGLLCDYLSMHSRHPGCLSPQDYMAFQLSSSQLSGSAPQCSSSKFLEESEPILGQATFLHPVSCDT